MREITAEITEIKDFENENKKLYIRFVGDSYSDKERYIKISPDEFNALVKLFVEKIVAKSKEKNEHEEPAIGVEDKGSGS